MFPNSFRNGHPVLSTDLEYLPHWYLDNKTAHPLKEKSYEPATFTLFLHGYWQHNFVSQIFAETNNKIKPQLIDSVTSNVFKIF